MSLQVWLPLNGNLNNLGLSNAIVTSEGIITIDSNGKIGKCYKFGTAKGRLTFPVSVMKNFTNACSIAFWIKINTWNTNYATIFQCGLGGAAWTAYRFGILRNNNNKLHLAISDGTNSYYSLATNDLTLGQWYHICFTYTTGKCSCYVNGTFLRSGNTTVAPGFNGATVATIGAINASGGYQCDMYLNDFRIYDHCLSAKEVEEIAKALILHYPLDNNGLGNLDSAVANSWGQDIVYDCSGYGNDGTVIGSLTTITDTPRYNCATNFDENTDSITIAPYLSNGQTLNEITVSCWFKTNTLNGTTPNIFSLGENAFLRSRLASATSVWNYYRVVSTQKTTTYSCKNLIDNNWHLLTFTFQNGVEKTYIDGEQIGSTDQSSTGTYLTCNTLDWHLAGYRANSENFIGSLSDFRIYATALTEAQIKELYTTAAAVDKNGNIYARELVEV